MNSKKGQAQAMKKIDLETHFITKEYMDYMNRHKGYPRYGKDASTGRRRLFYTDGVGEPLGDSLIEKLLDLGKGRLENMDKAGIDVQVLSLTSPGVEQFDAATGTALARAANDELHEAVQKHPDRFVGFAALAPKDPEAAADELERAVSKLGFKGWKTHSNYGGEFLDDRKFWPILERAENLGVAVYLHPAVPNIPQLSTYGIVLAGPPFGFGIETCITMVRLIYSGVFDRFPRLKIMLGHYGEGMPFLIHRIDFAYLKPWFDPEATPKLQRKPSDYLRENVFYTTSGNYFKGAFDCTVEAVGVDRVLLSTDYPYEDSVECMEFLNSLSLSREDREKIFSENAKRVGIVS
ncbi:MAG: amidohydrolase [Desulfobacteraceae bacterium]|nr:MAG: amidohydrolase [Desulfobacteraceae bacterium]